MSTLVTGLVVVVAFHALGLGAALWLRSWTALPWRFLAPLTLLAIAILSYGVFWLAFAAPALRLTIVAGALAASVGAGALALRRVDVAGLRTREAWGPPLAAVLLAAIYVCPLLPGGPDVNDRFTWKLPSDNILPALFAQRIVTGTSTVRPMPPLWPDGEKASERPPLQAAIVVTVGSLVPGLGAHEYQILATLCQAQWLPALWLIGVACGFPRRTIAFVLLAGAVSGFFFVNTIYTWPKLLAASLMLGALAIALEPVPADAGASRARVVVTAVLAVLSLLAHPGPAYTLVAAPLFWPLLRPIVRLRATPRATAIAAAVALAIVAPWLAYQAFVDPPTGRLLREHLGDGRPVGSIASAIVQSNVERPIGEHVRVRIANLASQLGDPVAAIWPASIARGQQEQFFHHGAALGVLLIGLALALAPPRAGTPDDIVRRLAAFAIGALVSWSLLVFARDQAIIHHGSPVTTALLFFAGAYGLTRLPRAAAWTLVAVHAAVGVYVWFLPAWRGPWLAP